MLSFLVTNSKDIVNKIIEIDAGSLNTYSGDYEFYEQQRAQNAQQQQAQFERQQAMLAKEIKFIERFKARASHAAQVQSRVKKLEKIERVEPPKRREAVQFDFPVASRSGDDVAMLKSVSKSYGTRSIYEAFDFAIRRKERGHNGVNARQIDLTEAHPGAARPDTGSVTIVACENGLFRAAMRWNAQGDRTVF